MLETGAVAYIPDRLTPAAVANAIKLVISGAVLDPLCAVRRESAESGIAVRSRVVVPQHRTAPAQTLTPRLRTVLCYLAQGASNKEIAERLGIAEGTVKVHVSAIIKQFGARNRNEAVQRSAISSADSR